MTTARSAFGMLVAATVALGLACGAQSQDKPAAAAHDHDHAHDAAHASMFASVTEAVAVVIPTEGNKARGTVRFSQQGQKVRVTAEITGLTPNTEHGFHVHEFGDASSPDGTSAGGHYNPEGAPHAGPDTAHRHAGDLGNLKADTEGKAKLELTVDNLSVAGTRNPVIGRAVVVHAKADDLKSQPTGDAGGRIGVGVIGVAKSQPAAMK